MKKMVLAGVLVVALLGLLSAVAFSAPGPQTGIVTVNAAVAKSMWLDVTKATVSIAGGPDIGDVNTSDFATFAVKANWDWTLTAETLAPLASTDPLSSEVLPGGSIQIQNSGGTWVDADAAAGVLVGSGTTTASTAVTANYQPNFQWTDVAGGYQGTQVYTLAFQ